MIKSRRGKLLVTGGYRGLEAAVGKVFTFTKVLGHWELSSAALAKADVSPVMKDYAFFEREIEFICHQ